MQRRVKNQFETATSKRLRTDNNYNLTAGWPFPAPVRFWQYRSRLLNDAFRIQLHITVVVIWDDDVRHLLNAA